VLLRGEQKPIRMSEQAARLLDYGFALPAGTELGRLVETSPAQAPPDPKVPKARAAASGPQAAAARDGGSGVSPVLIALSALTVLAALAGAVLLRRRQAG